MGAREGKEWVLALDWTKQGKQVWATPAGFRLHGRLYLRDQDVLLCYEVRAGQ